MRIKSHAGPIVWLCRKGGGWNHVHCGSKTRHDKWTAPSITSIIKTKDIKAHNALSSPSLRSEWTETQEREKKQRMNRESSRRRRVWKLSPFQMRDFSAFCLEKKHAAAYRAYYIARRDRETQPLAFPEGREVPRYSSLSEIHCRLDLLSLARVWRI